MQPLWYRPLAVNSQGLTGSPDIVVGLLVEHSRVMDLNSLELLRISGIFIKDNNTNIGIAAH